MAEVLLGAVLSKLANFTFDKAIEKALSFYGIRDEVDKLSRELNFIKAFIKDADRKHIVEKRQMQWVKDIIDIAYDIEDVIDIFHSECPEKLELPGIRGRLGVLPKKISKIPFLYQFQQGIRKIQSRIGEIKEFREKYEITMLGTGDKIPPPNTELNLNFDDSDVIGFDTHRDNVVKCLLDERYRSLAVVSIVGSGGLGKTTLARKVCNSGDVSENFGKPIWITVSQAYDLLKILQEIAKHLSISSGNTEDKSELATKIRKFLENNRYLIVFYDVWTEDLWEKIKNVMPDKSNGSRVLITTRFENVAKMADTKYDPYVPILDDEQSLKLFLRKAIPKKHQYPDGPTDDFRSLAKKFITKCKGLPLALVVLGGLLSTKKYDFHEWNTFLDTMSWQVDGSKCIDVIATSYEYLPLAKKLCFLYFAAYPEDYIIEIKPLLRIWVAERLIPQEDRRTLEETAECFLKDLIQRSMIQVTEKDYDGSIFSCRVHDDLRDLAIQKAKEMNFFIVRSKPDEWKSCNKARRVAIYYSSRVNELMGDYANPNIRSLLLFGNSNLDCSKYKVLRVFGCMDQYSGVLRNFKGLPHLRYLKLYRKIEGKEREFGEWIRGMKYLETLDLGGSEHGDLSKWIWQVKTLRHAILYRNNYNTQGPPASVDLRNLQTLTNVNYSESRLSSGSPNITEVRALAIQVHEKYFSNEEIVTLLHNLEHLVTLDIRGISAINLGKIIWKDFPFYKNLKNLHIIEKSAEFDDDGNEGVLTADIDGSKTLVLSDDTLPPHLVFLRLIGFEFVSDPMSVLQKLQNLKVLVIRGSKKEKMLNSRFRCSAEGFKQLEQLRIYNLKVDEWEIESGAMPMLKKLTVFICDPLRVPLELVHLPSLYYLSWDTEIQTNEDRIRHILEQRPDVSTGW